MGKLSMHKNYSVAYYFSFNPICISKLCRNNMLLLFVFPEHPSCFDRMSYMLFPPLDT